MSFSHTLPLREFQTLKDDLTAAGIVTSDDVVVSLSYTRPGYGQQRMEVMYIE